MSSDHTPIPAPPPWRWLDNHTLVADHGRRPVVLASHNGEDPWTRDLETGLLVQLTSDHPVARAIGALPDLLAACEAALADYEYPRVRPDEASQLVMGRLRVAIEKARSRS